MPTIDRFMVACAIELARAGRRVAVIPFGGIHQRCGRRCPAMIEELRQAGEAAARVSFEINRIHGPGVDRVLPSGFSDDMRPWLSVGARRLRHRLRLFTDFAE